MKNRKRFSSSDVRAMSSKGEKKLKGLRKELEDLKNLASPEIIEKLTASMIASQTNTVNKNLEEAAEAYLGKAVIVNPVNPEESMQRTVSVPTASAIGPVALLEKPYIYGYTSTFAGSAQFRLIFPFNAINAQFGHTGKIQCMVQNQMVTQEDILPFVRAFWFKNPFEDHRVYEIHTYKKFQERYQYKLIAELDDYVFEFPEWHPEFGKFTVDNARLLLNNLKSVDEVVVSTTNLKNLLIELGVETPISIIPNYLPKAYYGTDVKRFRLKDVEKPKILYNGTNLHYGNDDGDFEGPIKDFILKHLDDCDFTFMGVGRRADGTLTLPSYLQDAAKKNKIKVMPFYSATEYPYALRQVRPDYVIAPLRECDFNAAKSDLRYLESCAVGAIFIGQSFENGKSPYENARFTFKSVEDIESAIAKTRTKDVMNEELKIQYDSLATRWMDDANNLLNIVKVFGNGIDGVKLEPEHEQYNQFKGRLDEDGFFR